jgi:outer membrane usher protein FimD/PapC
LSDTLTLGLNGQATDRGVQLGGVAILGTPLGFFQLETSASKRLTSSQSGVAASLDYRGDFSIRQKEDLRLVGSAVYRSANFQDAFTLPTRNSRVVDAAMQVQWLAPLNISTGLGASYSLARDGGFNSYRFDLTLGRSFGRLGVSATGSRTVYNGGRANEDRIAVGVSLLLGRRDSANARYDSGTGRAEIELARAPEGRLNEISGNVRYIEDRDGNSLAGRLAYVNNRFDLVLNHNRIETAGPNNRTSNTSDWNIRTFIGYADGSVGLGRSSDEGFVIAPVHPTLHGSQASIMSGDRVIARSGLFGPALVPIGRAYSVDRYDVKVDPLPVGYDLGSGTISIFPGYGSGYRSMIGSDASRIAVGFLVTDAGPLALASGVIEPVDQTQRKGWKERGFFTNRSGRFVADRLAPGRYRLIIGGKAAAEFEVRKESEGVVDVGKIHVAP